MGDMRQQSHDLDSYNGRIGIPRRALRKDDTELTSGKLAQALTRLEVASAVEIRGIVYFFHVVVATALAWTIFAIVVVNGMYVGKGETSIPFDVLNEEQAKAAISSDMVDEDGIATVKMRNVITSYGNPYHLQMISLSLVGTFLLFVLGVLFLIRLAEIPSKSVTPEQFFACGLLFGSLFHVNLVVGMYKMGSIFRISGVGVDNLNLEGPFLTIQTGIYGPCLLLHAWCVLHYYRILDPPLSDEKKQALPNYFFVVKLAFLLPFSILKMVSVLIFKLWPSDMPLLTAIGWMYTFWDLHPWRVFSKQGYMVVALSLYEVAILLVLVREFRLTLHTLRTAPYLQYRTKQTGFRFFAYIGSLFFFIYFMLSLALIVGFPRGIILSLIHWASDFELRVSWSHKTGPTILLLGYVIVTAFVNLPSDSIGTVTGWYRASEPAQSSSRFLRKPSTRSQSASYGSFSSSAEVTTVTTTTTRTIASSEKNKSFTDVTVGSSSLSRSALLGPVGSDKRYWFSVDHDYELNQEIVEPVTYRHKEAVTWMELHANCFTMQTHIILFNFAWYVYYYGTPKEGRLSARDVVPFSFRVAAAINEPTTDTQVIVIDGSDRIIVSFKGSTSFRNLRTSLAGHRRRLCKVVPTVLGNSGEETETMRWYKLFGSTYTSACVHAGFGHAYASVAARVLAAVRTCLERESRPVMLCGHSLGGALATICSLDIWGTLRLSRRHILVSTYGSPRVGNESFQRLYDSAVPLHWRVVCGPDAVSKLPKLSYRHVGRKVLLSNRAELRLDPSPLDSTLWTSMSDGLGFHRKACYLLALRKWCLDKHPRSYTPKFWAFPITEADRARFYPIQLPMDLPSPAPEEVLQYNGRIVKNWAILAEALVLRARKKDQDDAG